MKVVSLIFSLLFLQAVCGSYVGTFKLKQVKDASGNTVDVPNPTSIVIEAGSDTDEYTYGLNVADGKGNRLFGTATLVSGTGASDVGPTMSTRKYSQYTAFERNAVTVLNAVDTVTLTNGVLVMNGSEGKMNFQKVGNKKVRHLRNGANL